MQGERHGRHEAHRPEHVLKLRHLPHWRRRGGQRRCRNQGGRQRVVGRQRHLRSDGPEHVLKLHLSQRGGRVG